MADPTESRGKLNLVELSSVKDSKITTVSLYTGLAEVTRVCNVALKEGDNRVVISGLPNALIQESLRVEGRGPCTIHEVSISDIPARPPPTTSDKLKDLLKDRERVKKALHRCQKCIDSINAFQDSITTQHVAATSLKNVHEGIGSVSEELDTKLLDLEEQIATLTTAIEEEKKLLGDVTADDSQLRQRVSITVVAASDCEANIVLIYGVTNATWDATYDISVKMEAKEKPVSLIYKGAITQGTGEAWEDVSLTLETVSPTFGVALPELSPWTLSVYRPVVYKRKGGPSFGGTARKRAMSRRRSTSSEDEDDDYDRMLGGEGSAPMPKRGLRVSSKGNINATFAVPGLITIPCDQEAHNVTITELDLDAVMSWVSVPKKSAKAHLIAKIKNTSEYTFLNGTASIYVDGSFISRSVVPPVSPEESFDCPLGIDPTIRLVYHPRSKKVNHSGFTRKTCSYIFEQRISITNTKSSSITGLKIHEQIPVSEDATITVNLAAPPLVPSQVNKRGALQVAEPVNVSGGTGVQAQWDGMDEPDMDPAFFGKDGKLNWVCAVPAQGKLNLSLSWEVVCPYGTDIMGLDV